MKNNTQIKVVSMMPKINVNLGIKNQMQKQKCSTSGQTIMINVFHVLSFEGTYSLWCFISCMKSKPYCLFGV